MALSSHDGSSTNYLLLKPEEVNLFDLIKILFSPNIGKRKSVDSAEEKEYHFGRRWLIFLSIMLQKLLQFISKPLATLGSIIEIWINFLSINNGFAGLLLNILRGDVAIPDKKSASYVSFTGSYDLRTELDRNIKRGDPRYLVELSVMASKLAYENKAYTESIVKEHWEMEFLGSFDFWNDYQGKATTQAFLLRDKKETEHDTIVVAFRGTEPFDAEAWCSDIDLSWHHLPGIGKIHCGFLKALGQQKFSGWTKEIKQNQFRRPAPLAYYHIRDMLKDVLSKNDHSNFIVTGHSLGGALAAIFPAILAFHDEKLLLGRLEGVYTFGQPRVGDEHFVNYMEAKYKEYDIKYYRIVYGFDIVPRVPYDDKELMFKHFGKCIYVNRHYEAKVVREQPDKNYFSPFAMIPMRINAAYELLRSFTIPLTRGRDYQEGWLMITVRMLGLVIPGIPNHLLQDYVNSIRLGSANVFLPEEPATI
ncbi:hypothetical protein Tsubulata_042358 [Turnera subulata]|uniref:Fungal lipase-type domain-containing protein n=1 Tax=Turnera subulata TaxID=218843 RepID=A0A9Q0FH84_9ROSI|nr:hypothetical protein Tsubulata_042358 [Turnera subulata]